MRMLFAVIALCLPAWAQAQEIRLGLMAHDVGLFGRQKEDGRNLNAEFLFAPPGWLESLGGPRPHLGISVNDSGDTSQAYAGLTWGWRLWSGLHLEASFGGAVHNGHLDVESQTEKALGSRLLFRESLALGWRFDDHHSLWLMLDHVSNARLADHNEGLDTFGLRYGYRF